MRAAKLDALRSEAAALQDSQSRAMLRSADRSAHLRRDLAAADRQHEDAIREHAAAVEQLLAVHRSRAAAIVDALDSHVDRSRSFLAAQRSAAAEVHAMRVAGLRAEVEAVRQRGNEQAAAAQEAFAREFASLTATGEEELHVVRLSGEATLNGLRGKLSAAEWVYAEQTASTSAAVQQLTQQEAASAKSVGRHTRELAKVQETAASLAATNEASWRRMESANAALRAQKDAQLVQHNELKRTVERNRDHDAARLRDAAVETHSKTRALTAALATIQRLTRLAQMNARTGAEQRAHLVALGVAVGQPGTSLTHRASLERDQVRAQQEKAAQVKQAERTLGVSGSSML